VAANRKLLKPVLLGALLTLPLFGLRPAPPRAQELERELVANLSAGRVLIAVTRDAIVLGTAETRTEAGAHPPAVVPLGAKRIAILLGATEWVTPDSSAPPVHLDAEFPRLINEAGGTKHLGATEQANDIELMGVAFLERLRVVAAQLHRKVELGPDEPLIEIVYADYVDGYGPEVWDLRYRVAQDALRGDFWRTRVLRPSYTQLYPPEKGQPKTLIEIRYPPDDTGPGLLDRLRQNDPKLLAIGTSDPRMTQVVERLLHGESPKLPGADAAAFLRAALPAVSEPDARLSLGVLDEQKGLDWLIAPPEPAKPDEDKTRPPGAPSLRKKSGN
jgi:hypothetical protein